MLGLIIGVLSNHLIAQTYYSTGNNDPAIASNWNSQANGLGTPYAGSFDATEDFIIQNGHTLTTASGNWVLSTAGTLTIQNGGVLRATSSGVVDLSATTNLVIENGGLYRHNNSANISLNIFNAGSVLCETGSTFQIETTGTSHTNPNGFEFDNLTITNNAAVTFTANIVFIANVLTINAGSTLSFTTTNNTSGITDALAMSTAGTGTLNVAGLNTNIPSGITWTFTVNYNRSVTGSQRIQGGTYTNLNASGGNRSIQSGVLVTIAGTFTPGLGVYSIGANSTIEYSANGSLTIPNLAYQNLTISGTGTKTIASDLTILGTLNIDNSAGFLSLNGNTLNLNGTSTNLTNGKLIGSATSKLSIGGTSGSIAGIGFNQSGTDNYLQNLTINRASGGAILLTNVNIVDRLSVTAGSLNTNNNVLGLLSTGISSTARVDQVTGSISYGGSGGVRVERYIPSGFRSYRDLTPTVYSFNSHILENWQEDGNSPIGYGTHITGVRGGAGVDLASGLDITQTGNSSMFTYNGTSFPAVTNTASTILDPYRGYRILIRGDRNVDLYTVPTPTTMNRATTLRATGKLIYGDVTYSTSGVSNAVYPSSYSLNSSSSTGFSLIGNPYACPVSWGKVLDNSGTANVQSTYWYFDPTLGINGVYATWIRTGGGGSETGTSNGVGNTNNFIQPGQAIFIRNNSSTSPSVKFEENDKAISSSATSVFSVPLTISTQNKIGLILQKYVASRGGNVILDGATLLFDANNSNSILTTEDAGKISNGSENLALVNTSNGTNLLSIESRKPVTEQDTIALRLWQVVNNDAYTLNIIPKTFSSNGRLAFVNDAYLKKQTFIRNDIDSIKINFTTLNTDSNSYFRRFSLVFKQPTELNSNSTNISLTGTFTGTLVGLNWMNTNDNNFLYYEVEKSTNGFEYTTVAKMYTDGTGSYSYIDTSINARKLYYRIRYYNTEAQYGVTNTVLIEPSDKKSNISVYPNPVSGNTINVQMNQLEPGNYQLAILDNHGRIFFTKQITHQNNSSTIPVNLNQNFTNGLYRLKLTHMTSMKVYSTNIVFQSNK